MDRSYGQKVAVLLIIIQIYACALFYQFILSTTHTITTFVTLSMLRQNGVLQRRMRRGRMVPNSRQAVQAPPTSKGGKATAKPVGGSKTKRGAWTTANFSQPKPRVWTEPEVVTLIDVRLGYDHTYGCSVPAEPVIVQVWNNNRHLIEGNSAQNTGDIRQGWEAVRADLEQALGHCPPPTDKKGYPVLRTPITAEQCKLQLEEVREWFRAEMELVSSSGGEVVDHIPSVKPPHVLDSTVPPSLSKIHSRCGLCTSYNGRLLNTDVL